MHGGDIVDAGHLAGADCPHRLIGQHQACGFDVGGHRPVKLGDHHGLGIAGLTLFQRFANANHYRQTRGKRRPRLFSNQRIAFAMRLAAFRMTKQHPVGTAGCQHRCGNVTSMRPGGRLVAVLPTEMNAAALQPHRHLHKIGRWRKQDPGHTIMA